MGRRHNDGSHVDILLFRSTVAVHMLHTGQGFELGGLGTESRGLVWFAMHRVALH